MQGSKKKNYYVYILLCDNGSFYTGYTDNLEKRLHAHAIGKASKYTRSFKPIRLVYTYNVGESKSDALKLENKIKKFSRSEKEAFIQKG